MKTNFVLRLAGLALATLASALPSLRAQETAWAWIAPAGQGASWTPGSAYQHSTTGGTATVARVTGTTNQFRVTFPGFTDGTGVVLVSAYGGSHTAVVNGWGLSGSDLQATVTTFDASGNPAADGAFTITYRIAGGGRNAFLWANQPSAGSYTPSTTYSWNGTNADPTITRSAPGTYRVRLPGLAPPFSEEGHVQMSIYGSVARRATVEGWYPSGGDMIVDVLTSDMAGTPSDARFTLSYNEYAVPISNVEGSGAHVWANDPSAASYTPAAPYTDSNGRIGPNDAERIQRIGTGEYVVDLPDCASSSSSIAQVTAYGTGDDYASIYYWTDNGCGGARVYVRTYDVNGAPTDAQFTLLYLTNRPNQRREIAWAWVDPSGQGASFTPSPSYSYAPGGSVTVQRVGGTSNEFTVVLPGFGTADGVVHASAYGGNHTAVVVNWTYSNVTVRARVALYQPNGAPANDAPFTVHYRRGGNVSHREAYLWANNPTAASYTPSTTYSWNADRPDPTITRTNIGQYAMTLPGLGQSSVGGHVQVTPYGGSLLRAKVAAWAPFGDIMSATVLVTDSSGNPTDGRFVFSYQQDAGPIDERLGSGAHVWANNASAASPYAPSPFYFDSNGIEGPSGQQMVTRLSTGRYRVDLPDVAPSNSSIAQVTAYGSDANYASLEGWSSNGAGGTRCVVRTYAANGSASDARFNLFYLTDSPAVPIGDAQNFAYGTSCGGLTLEATTLPLSCMNWELDVDNFPAGSLFGFVQLDLVQASTPIHAVAPGCTVLTGGAVTSLFLDLNSTADYVLPIPGQPVFLGVDVFAQGGAWVPGVNSINIVLSNGVRGTVGNN